MKNKKLSVLAVLAISIFATLMCLYSSNLTEKSVTAGRIFSGEITGDISTYINSIENCCKDSNCSDGCNEETPNLPNDKDEKNVEPIKGDKPPIPRLPHLPPREKKN